MVKFIAAAIWICAVTVGAVFFSFQSASAPGAEPAKPMFGGLDYVKTEIISVPLLRDSAIKGYFLTRLVYTVDPKEMKTLSVPAEALITDQVYSYLYSNPQIDFENKDKLDLEGFRNGVREAVNKRIGKDLVHDVLVEQVDFLTKDEIRDNAIRRRTSPGVVKSGLSSPTPEQEAQQH